MSNDLKDKKEDSNPTNMKKEIFTFIRDLAIILIVFALFTAFIADRTRVIGDSMEPHIHDGDFLILNKLGLRFKDPERFDIIVFPYNSSGANYIKRIIGMPGETIEIIEGGVILINGEILEEDYGNEEMRLKNSQRFYLEIPENEYFVLGDNRNNSSDSRYMDVGTIPRKKIIGKVGFRIWPLNNIGKVE